MEALDLDILEHKEYTIEDIYALPDGKRAEIINGQWYDMAPPNFHHQELVMILSQKLYQYVKEKGGKCKVLPAPFAVFLNKDSKNYVEPDISVICDPEKISERGCEGAPDLVIEIVSPASQKMDYGIKLFKYRTAGVREYWIVDARTKTVTQFFFSDDEETADGSQHSFDDELHSHIYPEFTICLSNELNS